MKSKVICGIQQVGIGVSDFVEAWRWYYDHFGFEIKIVDDEGVAERMLPYTGGKPQPRRSGIAINLRGGGGFEIWQPKGRPLNFLKDPVKLGDRGILVAKVKTPDIEAAYNTFINKGLDVVSEISTSPIGQRQFFMRDPYGNLFQLEQDGYVFIDEKKLTGGANGATIGVSDIDRSLPFYTQLLDYDKVVFDHTAVFDDLTCLPGGEKPVRRVILERSKPIEGPLSRIMGTSHLELIQATEGAGKKLYENRFWGDPGFIHLCFDVRHMAAVKAEAEALGHPFVCDSGADFGMGDANGHFTYVEDPDGTLIEFVETYKIPIVKKLGIYLNLSNKDDRKPLGLLKLLRFAKVSRDSIR
ncbi:MAG: VOC family protein [Bacteroidales bacterium]|nr:VOC family protein [Bacteroidales bacterium]